METGGLQGPIRFHVVPLDNRTLLATLVGRNATSLQSALLGRRGGGYDGQGALSYVVVVLCIYAFSIILMIGSVIKKSKHDNAVNRCVVTRGRIQVCCNQGRIQVCCNQGRIQVCGN